MQDLYVPIADHDVLKAKLKALEGALNIDSDGLDWDGSLDDAEEKLKELIPLLMEGSEKEMQEAQKRFDTLDSIIRNHADYIEREARKAEEWESEQAEANAIALSELRALIPVGPNSVESLQAKHGLTRALSRRIFGTKILKLLHLSPAGDISKMHAADLRSLSHRGLDIRELRAIYAQLPLDFSADGDGKKKGWREQIKTALMALVKKEQGGTLSAREKRHPAYSASGLFLSITWD